MVVLYGTIAHKKFKSFRKVQKEAGRMITGLRKNSSKNALYSELGWEPLYM